MFFQNESAIRRVVAGKDGGVFRRLDENRALLELLQQEAPELLRGHPSVGRWLRAQDDFLAALQAACPRLVNPASLGRAFPRPWPMQATPATWVGGVVKGGAPDSDVVRPLTRRAG